MFNGKEPAMLRNPSHLLTRSARGKVSPILVVLVAALVAAGGVFVFMKSKGKSVEDWQFEAETQVMLEKSLQEAKDYFGDQNPTLLPPDPNGPPGAEPTAHHYIFTVTAGNETLYFYIMHNFSGDRILAHRESDSDGPW